MPDRKRLKRGPGPDGDSTAEASIAANVSRRHEGGGNGERLVDGDVVADQAERTLDGRSPAFELVVLGSGGGPLETDCSGYLLKPFLSPWEDGMIGLEGGSGLGALSALLASKPAESLFPTLKFPPSYDSPVLKAAYVFSCLACYLITHAHLDHAVSLILLSGSVPPRPTAPPAASLTSEASSLAPPLPSTARVSRIPVYATKTTLESLAEAYDGKLWPELGIWAEEKKPGSRGAKRKASEDQKGVGVTFSPLVPSKSHKPLHSGMPITALTFPVAHGHTAHGLYESSAMFLRYDPKALEAEHRSLGKIGLSLEEKTIAGREFLFFGDLESGWRRESEDGVDAAGIAAASRLNKPVWQEAAKGFDRGDLGGVFIECSYDSSRSAHLMYGHLSPPGLYYELKVLASLVRKRERPLQGLRVYVTHIKEHLVPHPSGKSARELVQAELEAIEAGPNGGLGVIFVIVRAGDRILL